MVICLPHTFSCFKAHSICSWLYESTWAIPPLPWARDLSRSMLQYVGCRKECLAPFSEACTTTQSIVLRELPGWASRQVSAPLLRAPSSSGPWVQWASRGRGFFCAVLQRHSMRHLLFPPAAIRQIKCKHVINGWNRND